MTHQKNDFIKGAIIGALAGAVAGLLIAPKRGCEMREDLIDGYNALNEKGCELKKNMREQSCRLMRPFQKEEEHDSHALLIGGAIGAVVAAVAAILLAPQSGKSLRATLGDHYEEIRERAEDFVSNVDAKRHQFNDNLQDWQETFATILGKLKDKTNSKNVNQLIDLASLGVRLFKQLKK